MLVWACLYARLRGTAKLGIGGTLCVASPSTVEGAQTHLRHGRMWGDYDVGGGGGGRYIGPRLSVGWRSIRQSRWRGERYRIGIGGDGQDGIEI